MKCPVTPIIAESRRGTQENANGWLDLKIFVKTPFVVFKASGVYNDAASNWRAYLPASAEDSEKV